MPVRNEVRIGGIFYPQKKAMYLKQGDVAMQARCGNPVLIVDVIKWDKKEIIFQVADVLYGVVGEKLHEEIFQKENMVAYSCEMRGN